MTGMSTRPDTRDDQVKTDLRENLVIRRSEISTYVSGDRIQWHIRELTFRELRYTEIVLDNKSGELRVSVQGRPNNAAPGDMTRLVAALTLHGQKEIALRSAFATVMTAHAEPDAGAHAR